MENLNHLFENNRAWSRSIRQQDPDFFLKLSQQQRPNFLWIGCSDSRVPANQIVGVLPGELFVHRNIANLVVHTDLNCLSVMQFAVGAALRGERIGLSDTWLQHLQDIKEKHAHRLAGAGAADRLCELNVIEQVLNVCQTTIARDAWERGQPLAVHGWIYAIRDGLLRDLEISISGAAETSLKYSTALVSLDLLAKTLELHQG